MDLTRFEQCRAHKQWVFISNNPEGQYRSCCWFRTDIDASSPEEYYQKKSVLDIGSNCDYCINMEENGGEESLRTQFERNTDEDTLVITIAFDNVCNLKCVTCSPVYSSQIAAEQKQSSKFIFNQAPSKIKFMKELIRNTPYTKLRFEVLGGEPLINPAVFEFIDWLATQPIAAETSLAFTTNGTVYSHKIEEYSKIFKKIMLQFSIDGVDEVFDYLRYNSIYAESLENWDKFHQLSLDIDNVFFTMNYTLSWMNSLNFGKFINWAHTRYKNVSDILITKLEGPPQYSIDCLSLDLRKHIHGLVENQLPSDMSDALSQGFKLYTQHMTTGARDTMDIDTFLHGIDSLKQIDKIRNEDHAITLKDVLTVIYDYVDPSKKNLIRAESSRTFCILPWVHQYVDPGGKVLGCCAFEHTLPVGDMKHNTLEEIWNNEDTKLMRRQMLAGELVPGCKKCDNRDGVNAETFRDIANKKFFTRHKEILGSTNDDGYVDKHNLIYLDARFNNLCNFKCRTCGPRFSTSWHNEEITFRRKNGENLLELSEKGLLFPGKTNEQLYDEVYPHLHNLEEIYFAGGEPLMQLEHYKILDELKTIGHTGSVERPLYIYYNTNFSSLTMGKYNALDYWKHFNRLDINASIDGSYTRAEYWRKGTVWSDIENNVIKLKEECPHVYFRINYTLSWVNAYNLIDLQREWVEKNYLTSNDFIISFLDTPIEFNLKYLPKFKKDKIKELFLEQIEWLKEKPYSDDAIRMYHENIALMYSVETPEYTYDLKDKFLGLISKYDDIRNENFWDVFPEHSDMKEIMNVE